MPYIGKSTTIGVRQRYMYTATASQTTFSGTDTQNLTLTYTDSNFVDVYLNGVLLKTGTDYTATSGTSVVLASGAAADDIVEIIVYDTFAVANFYNRTDSDSRYVNIDGDTMTGALAGTTATFSGIIKTDDTTDATSTTDGSLQTDGGLSVVKKSVFGDDVTIISGSSPEIKIAPSDATAAFFKGDSNRSSAGQHLTEFQGYWNGTQVARIVVAAGDDTTNKDDGHLDFYTTPSGGSSTRAVRIKSDGNVGIGTDNPIADLSIIDSSTGTGIEIQPEIATGENRITNYDRVESAYKKFRLDASEHNFYISGSNKVTIDSDGDVGIGTDSPSQNLHISSSDHTRALITGGTNKYAELQFENDAQKFAMGVQDDDKFFLYNSTGTTQVLTVNTSNKVGIRTSNPGADLHVKGTMKIEGDASYFADTLAAVNSTAMSFNMSPARASVTKSIAMGAIGSSNTHTGLQAYDSSDNSANNFNINPYGGRVSIGTSAPVSPGTHNSRLAVEGTDYHSSTISISANSADSNGAYLMFSKSRSGSVGGTTVVADSDTTGYIGFFAADGLDVASATAAIYSQVDGSPGNNDTPGRIVFATTADDGNSVTNRMFITAAGVKIMNNTSHGNITSGNSSGASFDSAGTIHSSRATTSNSLHWYLYNSNGHVGSISTNGTATQFNTSSDYRLKENVVTDWDATSRLKQLKPSRFNFKTDKDTTVDGFLAHEVSSIVPEAITGEKDATKKIKGVVLSSTGAVLSDNVKESEWVKGKTTYRDEIQKIDIAQLYPSDSTWVAEKDVPDYQSIDQSKLVPLLVKTIQELEARLAKLEGE